MNAARGETVVAQAGGSGSARRRSLGQQLVDQGLDPGLDGVPDGPDGLDALAGRPAAETAAGTRVAALGRPRPVRIDTDDAFETAYTDLTDRIGRLAHALGHEPASGRP